MSVHSVIPQLAPHHTTFSVTQPLSLGHQGASASPDTRACAICMQCVLFVHQAYQDTMKQDTHVDHYRAHDNHVLRWLIQSHKFRLLITDMGKPAPRSVFNQTSLPPSETMEFQPTEQWRTAIWAGAKTILELFNETGAFHVVMLFPERSRHHLMYLSILQRNLAILYCAQKSQAIAAQWTVWDIGQCAQAPPGLVGGAPIHDWD